MSSPNKDPYQVLGVPLNATPQEIRAAYRKLALRFHPDRAGAESTQTFAEISHAYETLSDPNYVSNQQQQQQQQQHHHHQQQARYYHPPSRDYFTDPFVLFRNVFRDEFDGRNDGFFSHSHDPFRSASLFGRDPFLDDPFFGGRPSFEQGIAQHHRNQSPFDSLFGGGGGGFFGDDLFARHQAMVRDVQQQQQQNNNNNQYYTSVTHNVHTTSSNGETVQVTERTVNGQTVRQEVRTFPDGRVETNVVGNPELLQQTNNRHNDKNANPRIGGDNNNHRPALPPDGTGERKE